MHMTDQEFPSLIETKLDGRPAATRAVQACLERGEDGELFVEQRRGESLVWDDGRLRSASQDESEGFGLRAIAGEAAAYAHSTDVTPAALARAVRHCTMVASGNAGSSDVGPERTNHHLYGASDPAAAATFASKVELLGRMDAYARSLDPRVAQVSLSLSFDWQDVEILRADGAHYRDWRPLVRLNATVVSRNASVSGQGTHGYGGRGDPLQFLADGAWQGVVNEAVRQSLVALEADPAPAGEFDVVLGPGWPGVMLHEAVGHGLEGDFNRKKTSAFAGLLGQQVAARGVTVVDDGSLPGRRGSINIDDEGTPSRRTTLIEDGILVGYMQDRQNARLMKMQPTGNGRRQSFAHIPMPRMTNTFMLAGQSEPAEILASVKQGLYAVSFGGGQVDITSGKFVFSCTEAYLIENGKVTRPVKGATIIGNGPDALRRISMIGNDLALDPGIGTCGKQGQGVPVGVGQPTLRLNRVTIGGTAA
jgi:TldD protein